MLENEYVFFKLSSLYLLIEKARLLLARVVVAMPSLTSVLAIYNTVRTYIACTKLLGTYGLIIMDSVLADEERHVSVIPV